MFEVILLNIAVITGASSGVGTEFFKAVCEKYRSLDELWLVARRAERLNVLAENSPVKVRALSLDLTDKEYITEFEQLLKKHTPDIKILINNAGFGKLGYVYEVDYRQQLDMVMLNNGALTALCALCINYMQCGSFIINMASIAAFAPNPRMAAYCSTKAYVYSFSKCLREELKPKKINVLAVCPGPMNTEFLNVAGISGGKSKTFETLPYCDPKRVAYTALEKAAKGRGVYTPRLFFKFYRVLAKLLPHSLVMKMSKT